MIKAGDVCIWQNGVGKWAYLNGSETTVTSDLTMHLCEMPDGSLKEKLTWTTDTPSPTYPWLTIRAEPGDLRKKFPDADDEDEIIEKELETT